MNLEKFSDSQPSFLNLSLFICQLYSGGNFQLAHILYYSKVHDDRLYSAIYSTCPFEIPMILINVTTPNEFHLNYNERTDHILQLIFMPQEHLFQNSSYFMRIDELPTFYQIFIVSTIHDKKSLEKLKITANLNSTSLWLMHNVSHDDVTPYHLSKDLKGNSSIVQLKNLQMNSKMSLFASTLGQDTFKRVLGVSYIHDMVCDTGKSKSLMTFFKVDELFANFYYFQMNLNYINTSILYCGERLKFGYKLMRNTHKSVYKEFSVESKAINENKM